MVSIFKYDSDFSKKSEECKLLTLFFDALSFIDRQDKIINGRVTRLLCKIDSVSFEINVRVSAPDDLPWFVDAFVSQYHALKDTEENLFLFDIQVLPSGSSFDVTYRIYSTIPF